MDDFHVFQILQMVPNRPEHHIFIWNLLGTLVTLVKTKGSYSLKMNMVMIAMTLKRIT